MIATALVCDQSIGSFAATRTFQRFIRKASSGSPVKGRATEVNFKRRSTPSSKASQPFGNCSIGFTNLGTQQPRLVAVSTTARERGGAGADPHPPPPPGGRDAT